MRPTIHVQVLPPQYAAVRLHHHAHDTAGTSSETDFQTGWIDVFFTAAVAVILIVGVAAAFYVQAHP